MILGIQVIALVFSLIMIYFAYLNYRRSEINGIEMFLWLIAWIGAIFIALFPEIFKTFSATIAISRAFDLAVLGGFIVIIPLVYKSYVRIRQLEKKLEDLIRNDAMKGINNESQSKHTS